MVRCYTLHRLSWVRFSCQYFNVHFCRLTCDHCRPSFDTTIIRLHFVSGAKSSGGGGRICNEKKYEHARVRVFLRSRKNAQKMIFIFRLQNADFQSVGRGVHQRIRTRAVRGYYLCLTPAGAVKNSDYSFV